LYQLQFVGYYYSRFRTIFLTVRAGIFNCRLALCTDFLWLRLKVSRTLSTVSSVTLGLRGILSLMTDASSVTKLFIPPSDRRLSRTTTFKLPSERALNCHKIPGHTNYVRSVRQPFPSNTDLRFSREMAVATIGPLQMLRSLCVIDTNFTILGHFLLKLLCNENPPTMLLTLYNTYCFSATTMVTHTHLNVALYALYPSCLDCVS
jgi:hypothetical protein